MKTSPLLASLLISMALVGCNKTEKVDNTQTPTATASITSPTAPSSDALTASSGSATATATVTNAVTEDTPEAHKKAREKIMKEWGKANKQMGAMMKDPSTFDAATFKAAAAKLDQDVWVHFPENAKGGEAKDAVWTDAADFQQQINKYKTAANALITATQTATTADMVKSQQADVAASCKSCHEKFKKD